MAGFATPSVSGTSTIVEAQAPNASRNWAPKRADPTQVFDLAGNQKTSGPGLTQRSRFSKRCFSVPDPEFTPEADISCGHAKNRRLAVIGSLAPGLIAAVLGAGLGLSFGHDALGYPACLAVGGFSLFGAFARRLRRQGAAMGWFVALPFAFAWTIPETIRGTAMTGLPILSLGDQMVGPAFFGYAPIVGLYGVGFAAALASALFGMLMFARQWRVAMILVMALMADLAGGSLAGSVRWTRPAGKPLRIAPPQDGIGMSTPRTLLDKKLRYRVGKANGRSRCRPSRQFSGLVMFPRYDVRSPVIHVATPTAWIRCQIMIWGHDHQRQIGHPGDLPICRALANSNGQATFLFHAAASGSPLRVSGAGMGNILASMASQSATRSDGTRCAPFPTVA